MNNSKPNLRKMFGFPTTLVLVVVTLVLLRSCTTAQARVQHHHSHNHHLHNDNAEKPQHNHHQHRIVESSTNNPLPVVMYDDNEPTISEDETNKRNSPTSTTSTPSKHHHHQQQEQPPLRNHPNGQHFILNSSSLSTPTSPSSAAFSNFILEHHHTHQQAERHQPESIRLVPTPLPPLPSYFLSSTATATTQQYNNHPDNGGGHQRRSSSMAAKATNPSEHSKYSNQVAVADAAKERDKYKYQLRPSQRPQYHHHSAQQHRQYQPKHDYDDYDLQKQQQEKQPLQHLQKPEEDYYEEYNDEDEDDDDDIDGFIDDTDNNLSDRSYARITRSKLDDDYADDEPYRNAVEDQMQNDAAPGVLTEQKYLEVGNEKAVLQARDRYIQEQKRQRTPHELATEHWQRMAAATKCRKPLPRVIPVSNNTSKRYEPYATILHRCGEDTGCCGSTASVCTVKRYEIVMVYVFSYDFNYRKEIEALPMHNHTECHCVNRASLQYDSMPRGKRSGSWQHHLQTQQLQRLQQHHQQPQQQQQQSVRRSDMKTQPQPQTQPHHSENMLSCHCPRHFSVLEEDVERYAHLPRPHTVLTRKCRCDCLPTNQTCLRFKHGEEGFSLEDRKCIMEHNCKPPVCSLGDYNVQSGRCPSYRSHGKQKI